MCLSLFQHYLFLLLNSGGTIDQQLFPFSHWAGSSSATGHGVNAVNKWKVEILILPSLPSSRSESQISTRLYFSCLHNTPVISMATSPGMAGWRRRSPSRRHTLSKQMAPSQPHLPEGTRGEQAVNPWVLKVLLQSFQKTWIWSLYSCPKSMRGSGQTKRGRPWRGPKVVLLSLSG